MSGVKDPNQHRRLDQLLDYCRRYPTREIRTGRVRELYESWGISRKRSTARRDVHALEKSGHLIGHGPVERRLYRLNPRAVR